MKDTETLYKEYDHAVKYTNKIGAPQHHFRDGSLGHLISLAVATKICHQQNSGDKNYWEDSAFDTALSAAVKRNFQMLAEQALQIMKNAADHSLIAEKQVLKARLKEIEKLEAEQSTHESEGEKND